MMVKDFDCDRATVKDLPLMRTLDVINGRKIGSIGYDASVIGWYVEVRGIAGKGKATRTFLRCDSLEAAREKSLALGNISASDVPEV
jgi:hypothetical protein